MSGGGSLVGETGSAQLTLTTGYRVWASPERERPSASRSRQWVRPLTFLTGDAGEETIRSLRRWIAREFPPFVARATSARVEFECTADLDGQVVTVTDMVGTGPGEEIIAGQFLPVMVQETLERLGVVVVLDEDSE